MVLYIDGQEGEVAEAQYIGLLHACVPYDLS
jgi:hypothetical protein